MKRFRVLLHYSCGDPKTIRFEGCRLSPFAVLLCVFRRRVPLWQAGAAATDAPIFPSTMFLP